jgi:DNA-binding transcriptional ArsR family regulator
MDSSVTTLEEQPTIQDIYYLERIEQLEAIADPIRYRMCLMMTEPRTGAQLARALGITRARAHYHLNKLKEVGLVTFSRAGMALTLSLSAHDRRGRTCYRLPAFTGPLPGPRPATRRPARDWPGSRPRHGGEGPQTWSRQPASAHSGRQYPPAGS